ncbi:MAG: hypothetical protein DCC71_07665 [Proteobacteria bacterium]|nr:MAG: hypothetical protein DCC71_07665 [Pseudomonadota bacterium]
MGGGEDESGAGRSPQLDPRAFHQEVHSFEFWFQSVTGYLAGTHFGQRPGTPDEALAPAERERLVTVLCNSGKRPELGRSYLETVARLGFR